VAVVTGSTDGIGKAYAEALAARGFDLHLISRSADRLKTTAEELMKSYPDAKVTTFAADLSVGTPADLERDVAASLPPRVSILINNAGLSHEYPKDFSEEESERNNAIIAVNINAVNAITAAVLPRLRETVREGEGVKRGLILNIGSISGILPSPLLSVYGASKSYLAAWSAALAAEEEPKGIDVDCAVPFFVVSKMSKKRHASLTVPTPKSFVSSSLSKVGHGDWEPHSPYWSHSLMWFLLSEVSSLAHSSLLKAVRSFHRDIQRRAIKKAEREAKKDK
jgi:17beta-estradiol 17-dehydrogenase / very-long-chain 3-oxoacyl-CoA reductase